MPWFGKGETLVSQLIVLKNDTNGPLTQCYSEYTM